MPIYERMTVKGRAGSLQPYQSSQQAVAPGVTSARVSDAAAGIYARGAAMQGDGLGRLGAAIGKAGHTFYNAYEDYSKTKATELFNRYRMDMNQAMDGEGGIMSQVGENAFRAGQQTMDASGKLRGELLKDYEQDSRVAQIFNQLVDPQENAYHVKAQQHGEREYKTWQNRTDEAATKGYVDQALAGYGDPQAFTQGTAGAMWHVEQQLRRQGYSGEALERGVLEASSKIYKAGIAQAIEDGDFASAERLLGEGSVRMTEADRLTMQSKLQAGYDQHVLREMQALEDAGNVEALKRLKEQVENGTWGGAAVQGLNAGIAAQAAKYGGGRVKYYRDDTGRTTRDPNNGQIDCSGWVGWTLEQNGIKGFRSLNAEGQIDEAWRRGARELTQDEILSRPRENMMVCIDTGPKKFDRGRAKGIDHVVLTYRDPQTGVLMVSESSGGKGVRSIPWQQWAAQYPRAKFYGADLSTMNGASAAGRTGGPQRRPYGDLKLNEANNNPGNISGSGGGGRGYKAFNTTLEGFQALDKLIQEKYAGMTPVQFAEKFAPAGDKRGKNDPLGYAIQIARDLGMIPEGYEAQTARALKGDKEARAALMEFVDGDAAIDVTDRKVRGTLMRSIAKREGPTDRFNMDEVDYATGEKPIPEGYKSKDLRKESREQPGTAGTSWQAGSYMRPEMQARFDRAIQRAEGIQAAKQEKERKQILSEAKDAEYVALNKGDPTKLQDMEERLRGKGLAEEADKVKLLREGITGNLELYRQASSLPLPEAQKLVMVAQQSLSQWKKDGGELTPDEHRVRTQGVDAAMRVVKARAEAFAKDPALAAMQDASYTPDIDEDGTVSAGEMVAAALDVQRRNGVSNPQAIPKDQAAKLGEAWQQSPVPRAFLEQLQKEYGGQYPAVLRQLMQSKQLPADVALMDGMEPAAASLLAKTTQKDWKKQVEAVFSKDDKRVLQETVLAELEPFTKTFFAQGDDTSPATLADAAYRLGLEYMTQGMNADDAAQTAVAKLYGDAHKISGTGTYRIPVQYEAKPIEDGAANALEEIARNAKDIMIYVPKGSGVRQEKWEELLGSTIRKKCAWVNTSDGRGIMLVLDRTPVLTNDGKPVVRTFEELQKSGESKPALASWEKTK